MKKKIFYFITILIVGFLGGVSADFFLPYLGIINEDGTTIINITEEIIITENQALETAIDKISPTLVVVEVYKNKQLVNQGTGFIVTSDGLVVTAADLLPIGFDQILVIRPDWQTEAEVQKKETKNNLVLLKISKDNLPVVSLGSLDDLRLGQMIILIGIEKSAKNESLYQFINIGHIRSIKEETLAINLNEASSLANGGPLVNIEGKVIGLNLVDSQGLVKAVPVDKIQSLIFD